MDPIPPPPRRGTSPRMILALLLAAGLLVAAGAGGLAWLQNQGELGRPPDPRLKRAPDAKRATPDPSGRPAR